MVSTSIYKFSSTKVIPLGSCAFRQPFAQSHCRFIHGYRLQAKFWFGCNELDKNNWVVDFGSLKELKNILEKQFDHTTAISENDPERPLFEFLHSKGIIDLRVMKDGVGIEKFAQYCYKEANSFAITETNGRCSCYKVEVWEHESNSAIYEESITVATSATNQFNLIDEKAPYSVPVPSPVPSIVPFTQIVSTTTKPETPPLHNPKAYNTFKDPFAGTSWGNNARRTK